MTGPLLVFLVPLLALVGLLVCKVLDTWLWVADWWRVWRGRRRVRVVIERETARHVGDLVPEQREPTEPQSWWEFVPRQQGGDD